MKEMDKMSPDNNREIILRLICFAIKHRKIMQHYLDKTGVYQAQHRLLIEVFQNPSASQNDLARSMEVSPATIAVALKKLEKGGYIHREMDEGDNRFNKITLTEKGNRVVEQSRKIFETTNQKVFEGFTEDEKSVLLTLLQKLNHNLTKMEDEIKTEKRKDSKL